MIDCWCRAGVSNWTERRRSKKLAFRQIRQWTQKLVLYSLWLVFKPTVEQVQLIKWPASVNGNWLKVEVCFRWFDLYHDLNLRGFHFLFHFPPAKEWRNANLYTYATMWKKTEKRDCFSSQKMLFCFGTFIVVLKATADAMMKLMQWRKHLNETVLSIKNSPLLLSTLSGRWWLISGCCGVRCCEGHTAELLNCKGVYGKTPHKLTMGFPSAVFDFSLFLNTLKIKSYWPDGKSVNIISQYS